MTKQRDVNWPLPDDLEAERYVLGAMLSDAEVFPQVVGLLDAEDFALEKHQRIFLGLGEFFELGEPLSPPGLARRLEKVGQRESVGGVSYLLEIADIPRLVGLDQYCERIKQTALRRRLIRHAQGLIDYCASTDELGGSLAELERMQEVLSSSNRRLAARVWDEIIADEGGINQFLDPHTRPGIHLPFEAIHETLDGLRKGKLVLLGARPGVGKTAFAAQVAEHAAANGNHVLIVTLEMNARNLLHRSITGRAKVSAYRFRRGMLNVGERLKVQSEAAELGSLGDRFAIVDDSNTTVQAIEALLRTLAARNRKVDLVVIDYLQLLHSVGHFENRVQEVATISRGLKRITQTFDIPVLALSQLARKEDSKKREQPELDWLKESGQLEQDADQILFLWLKNEPGSEEEMRTVAWRVAKNRDGMLNRGTLEFQVRYCRFVEDRPKEGVAA